MDSDTRILILAILLFFTVAGAVILAQYLLRQAQRRSWGELASQLGLALQPGKSFISSPKVTGTYRGHELILDTFVRGTGRQRRSYTRIVMTVSNPTDMRMSLYDENVFSRVAQALGSSDIQVEDPEIDRRFRIKGEPEETVKHLFESGALRQQLLALKALNLTLHGASLRYEHSGVEKGLERLRNVINLLSEIATQVEQSRF